MKKVISILFSFVISLCSLSTVSFAATGNSDLFLDIHFVGNILFDKYAVTVYLDDEKIDTIPHGKDYSQLISDIENGTHTLSFKSYDDSSIRGETEIDIEGDTTFQCTLYAYSDEIKLSKINFIDNVDLSAIPVPDLNEIILSTALKELKDVGFVNIKYIAENDSIWEENNWIIVKQNLEPGTTAQKNEEIVLTCVKTKSYLEERLNGLSAPEAKTGAEDLGFKVSFVNAIIDQSIDNRFSSMSEKEKEEWIVEEIDPASSGRREAEIMVICTGERQVPDVTGVSLASALKTLKGSDFSNIKFKSTNGSSIWDYNNWQVISQDIEQGKTISANDVINLTVRSYKEIEQEQVNAGVVADDSESDDNSSVNSLSSGSVEEETTNENLSINDDSANEDNNAPETDVVPEAEPEVAVEEKAASEVEETEESSASEQELIEETNNPEVISTPDYEAEMMEMLSAEQDIESITASFAEKYAGVEINFEGNAAFVNDTGDEVLIHSGSYKDEIIKGPDILLEGYQRGDLKTGDQLAITATVKEYDQAAGIFHVSADSVSILSHSDAVAPDYTSGKIISLVQTRLNEEGFDCGAVDGLAGKKTHGQVQAFKESRGLTVNDSIDAELLAYLRISSTAIERAKATPTPTPEPTKTATIVTQAPYKSLEEKLNSGYAWQALEAYGKQVYPFGFKLHYIVGQIAERQYDADTWFLKAECTIENAFGNKYKTVCEGRVTGTTNNPQVVYFFVYD